MVTIAEPCWTGSNIYIARNNIFHFDFRCLRCADPTELGSYFSAMKCHETNCKGYLLMVDPLKSHEETDWKCETCKNVVKPLEVMDMQAHIFPRVIHISSQYMTLLPEDASDLLSFMKKMQNVVVMYEKEAHPNHAVLRLVREKLVVRILNAILFDFKYFENHKKPHDRGYKGYGHRNSIMTFAKVIVKESQFALEPSNYSTQGWTRIRGEHN